MELSSTTSTCLRPRFAIAPPSCAATDGDNDFDAKIPGGMASGSKEGFCASIRGLPSKSFEILAVIAGIEIGRYNVRSKRFIAILSTSSHSSFAPIKTMGMRVSIILNFALISWLILSRDSPEIQ